MAEQISIVVFKAKTSCSLVGGVVASASEQPAAETVHYIPSLPKRLSSKSCNNNAITSVLI
jgi:hypothetical protein